MTTLRTSLHSVVPGLRTPIVLGAMANASGGALAGHVSRAGGLGFLGAGYYTEDKLAKELEVALDILGTPKTAANASASKATERVHLGVGFLAWRLTVLHEGRTPEGGEEESKENTAATRLIDQALRIRPSAIWLSFGNEEEMVGWTKTIRQREAQRQGKNGSTHGQEQPLRLFIGVGNEEQARLAIEECDADVLIIQGHEAGGHGLGSAPPLSAIVPFLAQRLRSGAYKSRTDPSRPPPPLLAAGGIMTGENVAGVLAQGADGVVVGTRMLLTPEAAYTDAQKKALVEAGPTSTARTMAFDEARNTLGWPTGVDGRGIVNATVHDYLANKGGSGEARRAVYKKAEEESDASRIVTWAGTGIGLVDQIKPAEEVVEQLTRDAIAAIQRSAAYVAA